MDDNDHPTWWLTRLGNTLVWSRMQIRASGTVEVIDSSGARLNYDSPDSARADLLDAGFQALDGLDEDDALELGLPLSELVPPQGDEAELHLLLVQTLPQRH